MYFLGLDLSLRATGVCLMDEMGDFKVRTIDSGELNGAERLIYVENMLKDFLPSEAKVDRPIAAIEGYSFSSKFSRAHATGELGGVIRRYLHIQMIKYYQVAPLTLKKFITGKGKGEKNKVMLEAYKKWGVSFENDNEVDAYGLARILYMHFIKPNSIILRYEKEVLDKVFQPLLLAEKTKKRSVKNEE